MAESTKQDWPELNTEWASREVDMPNETSATSRVMPMGSLFKKMNPDAYAVTGPLGTIALNRELIEKDKQNLGDVLTHELTHVKQGKKGFLRQLSGDSEVESEAINREAMRKVNKNDVDLPSSNPLIQGPQEPKLNVAPQPGLLERLLKPRNPTLPTGITGVRG